MLSWNGCRAGRAPFGFGFHLGVFLVECLVLSLSMDQAGDHCCGYTVCPTMLLGLEYIMDGSGDGFGMVALARIDGCTICSEFFDFSIPLAYLFRLPP